MRLWACDRTESWSYPFQRVVLTSRTKCRLCEGKVCKEIYRIMDKEGLDYNPDADHSVKTNPWMGKGQDAIRLVTTSGPAGVAYICIPCAKLLLENLQKELAKK
jgi:hypothetical protein